ncbi:hypothetical protein D0812_07495 [Vibrio owensii]|uniref:Uncharacterized protein n=1 Tax=Vibrio owensii TaxID=696485 RepID=A0ABM6ZF40_9VIBR|nr:hypothetical protein D0812_07495 [Vibrio owensii]
MTAPFFSLYEVLKIKLEHCSSVFVNGFVDNERQSLNHFGCQKTRFLELNSDHSPRKISALFHSIDVRRISKTTNTEFPYAIDFIEI